VQDGVYDAFTKGLAETAGAMKVADGFEPGAVMGTDATTDLVITKEETFDPGPSLYRFKTENETVKMANDPPTLPSPARGEG
jgi:succinate-semialdehyde dehydrogenase / glutarate-semialdehyde dehydrogenase